MPCSRHVQSHRGPPGRHRHERKESALSDSGLGVTAQTSHDVGQETTETRKQSKPNPKPPQTRRHFACVRQNPSSARTTSPRPHQVHHATTQSKQRHRHTQRVCKCASCHRDLTVETHFPQLMLPASLKEHSGNDFNFARMANNFGRHQPHQETFDSRLLPFYAGVLSVEP